MSTGLTLRPLADEERDTIGRHTHSRTASAQPGSSGGRSGYPQSPRRWGSPTPRFASG